MIHDHSGNSPVQDDFNQTVSSGKNIIFFMYILETLLKLRIKTVLHHL